MKRTIRFSTVMLCTLMYAQGFAQWQLSGNANATNLSFLGTTTNHPVRLGTNGVERIRVATNGNIGIANTSPAGRLTVQGSGGVPNNKWVSAGTPIFSGLGENLVGNADFILSMGSNTPLARGVFFGRRARGTLAAPAAVQADDYLTSLLSSGYDGSNFLSPAGVDFFVDGNVSPGIVPARISFSTGYSGASREERLTIKHNGYVGVGTTNPMSQFHVRRNDGSPYVARFTNTAISADRSALVEFQNGFATWRLGTGGPGNTFNLDDGQYYLARAGASVPAITINENNRMGLNNTTPATDLHMLHGVGSGATNGLRIQNNGNNDNYWTLYTVNLSGDLELFTNGFLRGSFDPSSGAYTTISDARFKQNVAEAENVMDNIMKLGVKRYQFKNGKDNRRYYGLIAQEAEKVFPEMVFHHKSDNGNEHYTMDYTALGTLAIKGLQELKPTVDELQEQVNALKQELATIKQLLQQNGTNTGSKGLLGLVTPNPVRGNARIRYEVPENAASARMLITDALGRSVKVVQLERGGTVEVDASALSAGVYNYSLVVDGKTVATKRMNVIR